MTRLDEEHMTRLLMRSATADVGCDVDSVLRGATRRARSMRRRRDIGIVGAAALIVAVLAGASQLPLGPGADDHMTAATSDQPTTSVPATPTSTSTGPRGFGVAKDQMAQTLAAMLPDGRFSDLRNWSDADGPARSHALTSSDGKLLSGRGSASATSFQAGSLVYDDGSGAALVSVSVSAPASPETAAGDTDVKALCGQGATCRDLPEGVLALIDDWVEHSSGSGDQVVANLATLAYEDGHTVTLSSYNAPAEKDAAATRVSPPFTAEQLGNFAADSAWLR